MGDIKMTFRKSQVRTHVRTGRTGKQIAVGQYATRRAPATNTAVRNRTEYDQLPTHLRHVAKAPPCATGLRGKARQECDCPTCEIWRDIREQKARHSRSLFQKAADWIDETLKRLWTRKAAPVVAKADSPDGRPSMDAAITLGASEPAEHVSAQDFGPEHDPETTGGEDLPWTAEDHASAPEIIEDDAPAEIEQLDESPLAKAVAMQKALQAEIERLDQQLTQQMPDAEHEALLAKHLDYLIKADALTSRIDRAQRQSR